MKPNPPRKFTMHVPFHVHGGPRTDGYYTAYVLDKDGRGVARGRSKCDQVSADMAAMNAAREWARRVRQLAGI